MKENTEVPQDPYADGIVHPLRGTPIDVGLTPPFPPTQEPAAASTIGEATGTAATGGLIGDASSTCDNLSDCAPNSGE